MSLQAVGNPGRTCASALHQVTAHLVDDSIERAKDRGSTMPVFVHLTSQRNISSVRRSGIGRRSKYVGFDGVYAMPVTRNFYVSHQWLRELKRTGERTFVAIHFRIPDEQVVAVGHYSREHLATTATEAVSIVMRADNAEGYEILVPRAIIASEIHAIRHVPQVVGWRYFPGSHGQRPCGCPVCQPRGGVKTRKLREQYEASL